MSDDNRKCVCLGISNCMRREIGNETLIVAGKRLCGAGAAGRGGAGRGAARVAQRARVGRARRRRVARPARRVRAVRARHRRARARRRLPHGLPHVSAPSCPPPLTPLTLRHGARRHTQAFPQSNHKHK